VDELEQALADLVGVPHAVACASGTVAEHLLLMAAGIGPGDEVLVPDFTFAATVEAVLLVGATPVFVDIEAETFSMDLAAAQRAMSDKVKAVVPVSLFGHPAHLAAFEAWCENEGILMLEDACQSMGASEGGRRSGSFGNAAFTSFYPAKPLGGLGDGGMVFTRDGELAERVRRLRHHGETGHHLHGEMGTNARLNALQCAALLVRLRSFPQELQWRQEAAERYEAALGGHFVTPKVREGAASSWAQYTLRLPDAQQRDAFRDSLQQRGVPTVVHYPRPLHTQPGLQGRSYRLTPTPVSERVCGEVVSLPISADIQGSDQRRVIEAALEWAGSA